MMINVVEKDPKKKFRCPITGAYFVNPVKKCVWLHCTILVNGAITPMNMTLFSNYWERNEALTALWLAAVSESQNVI